MSTLKCVWNCMFSPKLIKIYRNGQDEKFYQPNALEKWSNELIRSFYVIWKIGIYTSPFIAGVLYQRGYFTSNGLVTLSQLVTGIGVILVVSFCFRSIGRSQNPTYVKFLEILNQANNNYNASTKRQLAAYEFEFYAWPIEFRWDDYNRNSSRHRLSLSKPMVHQNIVQYMFSLPIRIIAYLAIHTFGIRLVYPGSLSILYKVLESSLLQGRSRLIEVNRGERFKLQTEDKNQIDSMFIDRRNASDNGNILVICCEGNAGFYEIGIMATPLEAGYSVLGWNHPGFGESTGQPYPEQEHRAIDAVMQFAIHKLGFKVENIVLFGWSIGGYTSTFAAMNYPDIKGVVLDATFDDVLPLAKNQMPGWWEPIVRIAIREYINLNNFEQLAKYPGPVLLIRRTEDEVICLRPNDLSSNLGNNLLIKLLRHRYPLVVQEEQVRLLKEYLAYTSKSQDELVKKFGLNEAMCNSLMQSYISEYSKSFPMKIGEEFSIQEKNQMTLYLARKYMKDYSSSHCNVLPADLFQLPWDVHIESDFIFT